MGKKWNYLKSDIKTIFDEEFNAAGAEAWKLREDGKRCRFLLKCPATDAVSGYRYSLLPFTLFTLLNNISDKW